MAASTATVANSPQAPGGPARPAAGAPPGGVHNEQLVAELKHEINTLVQEIAHLAAQDIAPHEFYRGFLDRVVSAMAAVGGAVWTSDGSSLKAAYKIGTAQSGIEATPLARTQHGRLLQTALDGGQPLLVLPGSGAAGDSGPANPTELLLVLAPLVVERQPVGMVEIFQRAGAAPSTQRGYLRFVTQMAELASGYLKSRRLRQLEENQSLWRQLEQFTAVLHRSLDVRQTAYTIVNEGRRLVGCDRVSLALCTGRRCHIEAVSGLDAIDRRAAEVQRLARLVEAVLQTREPLWSDLSGEPLPSQIDEPLQAYVDRSHTRMIAVLPLVAPTAADPADDSSARVSGEDRTSTDPAPPLGALIVEQLHDAEATETLRTRAGLVAKHSALALAGALEHSSVFLLPVWKALGRATHVFRGRALVRAAALTAIATGAALALATIPTEFQIKARGKLQPAERREIFAPLDGIIARVPVEHGQIVEPGAVLAEMTNTDLDLELAALLGRQTTNQERRTALQRALLDKGGAARLPATEENRLAGEMLELRQEAQSIERELKLVRQKQAEQTIVAPQRGQVVTWKVRDLLLHRPVSRGQALMTLANPDGPWELELYLPERRLVHLQRASVASPVSVHFVLSSHPGQTFHGRVVEIEQTAEVRGDEGNTVLVRVAVEKDALPPLHDQTTVTAKLACGRASLGYAWFCDLVETVYSKILFWLPS